MIGGVAVAETFNVPPGNIQLVEFESEADIETIRGISTAVSGKLDVNLASPGNVTGKVVVPVATIKTGNTTRDEHLAEPNWLDAKSHPNLTFELVSASFKDTKALAAGVSLRGKATGKLTIKGVTKTITVPIRIKYIAASDKLKKLYIQGNALRVKSTFEVTLADFGIKPPDQLIGAKVAEVVTIKVALTAVDK